MTNSAIVEKGFKILKKELGDVETERFIAHIIREPFDYTKWRRDNLFVGMTGEEISQEAMKLWNETYGRK